MFDVLIKNGRIIDGSGNPWFQADIGIIDGKIAEIGRLNEKEAQEVLDAAGKVVSPGFIDIHCHSDAVIFAEPREQGKILQGVTTEVVGNCGSSAAPTYAPTLSLLQKYLAPLFGNIPLTWDWGTMGDFLDRVAERKPISNVASLVGHGTIRVAVMGFEDREPTETELQKMKELLAQSLEDGAFGLSSGLIYPPGLFSKTSEMIELCKVVAAKGGFYATHMRGEGDTLLESTEEALKVAQESGVSLEISHHKSAGRANWGKCRQTLQMIEAARTAGIDVTCDVYPYIAASTSLGTVLPPWMQEGGIPKLLERLESLENRKRLKQELAQGIPRWENYVTSAGWNGIMIAYCQNNKSHEGKSIQQIADAAHQDPADTLFDILLEEQANVLMNVFSMTEDDVKYIIKHPATMVGSDAIPSPGKPHPRFFGTFPRVLSKYVREDKVISLPEGIRKITSLPAQKLGLRDRGLLREGMWADLVVFDQETIEDKANFIDPQQYPVGIDFVLVNGQIAVRNGQYTGLTAGQVLRHV